MNKFKNLPEGAKKLIRQFPGVVRIYEEFENPYDNRIGVSSEEIHDIIEWNKLCRLRHIGKITEYLDNYIVVHQRKHGINVPPPVKRKPKKKTDGGLFSDLNWEDSDE